MRGPSPALSTFRSHTAEKCNGGLGRRTTRRWEKRPRSGQRSGDLMGEDGTEKETGGDVDGSGRSEEDDLFSCRLS